jgi:chaperonin GroES
MPLVPFLTMDQLKPDRDRLVVEPDPVEEKSKGGILFPDVIRGNADWFPWTGTVKIAGPRALDDTGQPYAPGTRLLFGRYAGKEVEIDGKRHFIMEAEEVWGVMS